MDAEDRAALLAAMYDDSDKTAKRPDEPPPDATGLRRSRRMVMGAVSFDIPTLEYTAALEQRLTRQDRQIVEQGRHLKRLELMLGLLRSALHRQAGLVGDLGRDLDRGYRTDFG